MNTTARAVLFWVVVAGAAMVLWLFVKNGQTSRSSPEISYSQFLTQLESDALGRVRISGNVVYGTYRDGGNFRANIPNDQGPVVQELRTRGVDIWFAENEPNSTTNWITNLVPILLLAALWFFMIRQIRGKRNQQPPSATGSVNGTTSVS